MFYSLISFLRRLSSLVKLNECHKDSSFSSLAVDKADSTIIHDNGSRVLNVSNVRRRFDTGKGFLKTFITFSLIQFVLLYENYSLE